MTGLLTVKEKDSSGLTTKCWDTPRKIKLSNQIAGLCFEKGRPQFQRQHARNSPLLKAFNVNIPQELAILVSFDLSKRHRCCFECYDFCGHVTNYCCFTRQQFKRCMTH